jgi:uncharacterized repeat protein (TIGR03803 family)
MVRGVVTAALLACNCYAAHAASTPVLTTLYQFPGGGDGLVPLGSLVPYNGSLYGTTELGGAYGRGAVFKINPATGAESLVYSFKGGTDAINPKAGLLLLNGLLYGTCSGGGAFGFGAVCAINPATGAEKVLASVTADMGGVSSSRLIANGGYLYGTVGSYLYGTVQNGAPDTFGSVFRLNLVTNALSTLYKFTGGADGGVPDSALVYAGGLLYGTAHYSGNAPHAGALFSVNATTGAEKTLFEFDGTAHGALPNGDLIDAGGVLYGTTEAGGSFDDGVAFAYTISTGVETTLYNFNIFPGSFSNAGLIDVGGVLYGTITTFGTPGGAEAVFSLNPATGAFTNLAILSGINQGFQYSPLLYQAGALFGTAEGAGATAGGNDNGTVYKVSLLTKAGTTLHDFRGPSLQGPGNSALLDNGGMLWGVRGTGGNAFAGDVYTVNATTKLQKTIYTFTGGADGGAPSGPLVKDGSTLYGIAQSGGANQGGVIYSINEVTGAQSVAYDFPAGASPNGSLFLVGNTLYGVTAHGGNGFGTVFRFNPSTKSVTTAYTFRGRGDGGSPAGGFTESGGLLYGVASSGGRGGGGVLFSFNPATNGEQPLYFFPAGLPCGYNPPPAAPVILNGMLYGVEFFGDGHDCGTLYSYDLSTKAFSRSYLFNVPSNAYNPSAALVVEGNTLYGTTTTVPNTNVNYGIVFSYTPSSNSFSTVYSFTGGPDGAAPNSGLIVSGGTLYGASSSGATYNAGVVFSLTP